MLIRPMMLGGSGSPYGGTPEATQSLPAMTSDSTPSGYTAFSSGSFSSGFPAWKAFDQVTGGAGWAGRDTPVFVGRTFPSPIVVGAYEISEDAPTSINNAPINWEFQASNDGASWTTLDTRANVSWVSGQSRRSTIPIEKRGPYTRYRLYITVIAQNAPEVPELYMYQVK